MSELIRCDICEKEGTRLEIDKITRSSFSTKADKFFDICTACSSQMFYNVKRYQMLVCIPVKDVNAE